MAQHVMPAPAVAPAVNLLLPAKTLAAGSDVTPDGQRWTQGVSFLGEDGMVSFVADRCSQLTTTVPGLTSTAPGSTPPQSAYQTFAPFAVGTGLAMTMAQADPEEMRQRVLRYLDAITPARMEYELALASANATNPHLGSASATIVGTALTPALGLALLEASLAPVVHDAAEGAFGAFTGPAGTNGMIHATPDLVTLWARDRLVFPEPASSANIGGGRATVLRTVLGTYVVAGQGYPGSSPAGVARTSGLVWAYATGTPLVAWDQGEIITSRGDALDGLDRDVDTLTVRAQRLALVAFDPVRLYAASITLA